MSKTERSKNENGTKSSDHGKNEEIHESLVENPPNFWMDKSLNLTGWMEDRMEDRMEDSSPRTSPQQLSINQHQANIWIILDCIWLVLCQLLYILFNILLSK